MEKTVAVERLRSLEKRVNVSIKGISFELWADLHKKLKVAMTMNLKRIVWSLEEEILSLLH